MTAWGFYMTEVQQGMRFAHTRREHSKDWTGVCMCYLIPEGRVYGQFLGDMS